MNSLRKVATERIGRTRPQTAGRRKTGDNISRSRNRKIGTLITEGWPGTELDRTPHPGLFLKRAGIERRDWEKFLKC